MHNIEPHYNWRDFYVASEDERSPFYGRDYSEFEFTHAIYNHCIHPQWDHMGSPTLFVKILYVNYDDQMAVIELIGEWNDCLHNDIMHFKRNVIDVLLSEGVRKFALIGENVLIFHSSDESYYEEWHEEIEGGWIAMINFMPHVIKEIRDAGLENFLTFREKLNDFDWRPINPDILCQLLDRMLTKRLIA